MSKLLLNQTESIVTITDVGQSVPASGSLLIDPSDYAKFSQSNDVIVLIADGTLIVNDGSVNLSISQGVGLLQGSFIAKDFVPDLKNDNRLKVELIYAAGASEEIYKSKISNADTSQNFLENKILGTSGKLTVTKQNTGLDENLKVDIGSDVFDKTIDNTDDITEGLSKLFYTDERAQDAIGSTLTDTSSIDLTYNDVANTISATVLPAGVDHNSLANLTSDDPHTQYVKDAGTVTDNAIARYDGTDGRTIQNSSVTIDDNGGIVAGDFIRPSDTSDTTNGNVRLSSGGEIQGREAGAWKLLTITPNAVSATADTSTSSGTYSVINTMTQTPSAGVYLCLFNATVALASNTSGDIALFVNGVEDTTTTRRLAINATGLSSASFEVGVAITTSATVNGSQAIDVRFRENGGGTMTVGPRKLTILPIAR